MIENMADKWCPDFKATCKTSACTLWDEKAKTCLKVEALRLQVYPPKEFTPFSEQPKWKQ